jgi:predicted transport protein
MSYLECLLLSINVPFDEVNDPKGLCRDVTDYRLGQWNVEIRLAKLDEIPYIIGLEAGTELQLGNGKL